MTLTEIVKKFPYIVDNINEVALEAGTIALNYFNNTNYLTSKVKGDGSVLTIADAAVEKFLMQELKKLVPGSFFLGEEDSERMTSDQEYLKQLFSSEHLWSVDPIDGTNNFKCGYGQFGVSISLLKNSSEGHVPVLGAVYFPLADWLLYTNSETSFSIKEGREARLSPLEFTESQLKSKIIGLNADEANRFAFVRPDGKYQDVRAAGSTMHIMAATVTGQAIGNYFGTCHHWDVASLAAVGAPIGVKMYDLKTGEVVNGLKREMFTFNPKKAWQFDNNVYVFASKSALPYLRALPHENGQPFVGER